MDGGTPIETGARQETFPLWVRVGGGLEEVPTGRRFGPADPGVPPPGGPWEPLWANGRLTGWAPQGGSTRWTTRRTIEESERIVRERRSYLLARLAHKLRSSILALQESTRQAAFGRQGLLEQIYDQAQDVGRRALALESVALDSKDASRAVMLGAVLNLAAAGARRVMPQDAVVRASEAVVVDALTRAYEWMGGEGSQIVGARMGAWWRLELTAAPDRQPLAVPELGEPLIRHLVDGVLEGWLDVSCPDHPAIYLPAL